MTDDVNNPTPEATPTENAEFVLTDEQKKKLEEKGITEFGNIKSLDQYKEALAKADSSNTDTPTAEGKPKDEGKPKNEENKTPENGENTGDEGKPKDEENKNPENNNALDINIGTPTQDNQNEDNSWIAKKEAYYKSLAEDTTNYPDIEYKRDETKDGFAANVYGSNIHYTSETSVTVEPEASVKVFSTLVNDPANKDRPVNFPENASPELATRLYAACVLAEGGARKMQGAVPTELDEAALANSGLKPEEIEAVKKHFAENNKTQDDQQKGGNTQEENKDQKAPESKEPQISQDAKDRIEQLQEIRKEFNDMKKDDKIKIELDESGKPKIVAGDKGSAEDVTKAEAIMKEAAELVKAGMEENRSTEKFTYKDKDGNTVESEKAYKSVSVDTQEALRKEQIETIRARLSPESLKAHDEKVDMVAKIHAARLGLTSEEVLDRKGNKVEKIADDGARKNYEQKLSKETMARITQKFGGKGKQQI